MLASRAMHRRQVIVLTVLGTVLQGCLGTMVGALVAPQTVAVASAGNLVNQGVSALDEAAQAATTAEDIDRMIARNPNATNSAELMNLRGQLEQRSLPATQARRRGIPPPPSEYERRLTPPPRSEPVYASGPGHSYRLVGPRRDGTQVLVENEIIDDLSPAHSRSEPKPFTTTRTSSIPPYRVPIYQYGWNPDPEPLPERRSSALP